MIPGRKHSGPILALTGALLLGAVTPAEAARRGKTRFDGIRDCERTGAIQLRRHDAAFRRFTIDRAHVTSDKYADRVGPMFVSTIYHGKAAYEAATGPRTMRFVCLHGGMHRRAVFVYVLPE